MDLSPLLHHIAYMVDTGSELHGPWQGWQITRIVGGANGLLYHATSPSADLAVKFTTRDERDRAGREYQALSALQEAGLEIAPWPVLLDRTSFSHPVVVQSWVQGWVSAEVPVTDEEWDALLRHMALLHTLTPERTTVPLPVSIQTAQSVDEARALVCQQVERVPQPERPARMNALLRRLEQMRAPSWPPLQLALCHTDPNITNYVRRPDMWMAVDWDNSGWGDPAFELADLVTHPAYLTVPASRWEWVIERYCDLAHDRAIARRTQAYRKVMLVWWVARLCRYRYEIPRGLDKRLASPSASPSASPLTGIEAKLSHYLDAAELVLACSGPILS
jgi:thiamine kinase-like enzyme